MRYLISLIIFALVACDANVKSVNLKPKLAEAKHTKIILEKPILKIGLLLPIGNKNLKDVAIAMRDSARLAAIDNKKYEALNGWGGSDILLYNYSGDKSAEIAAKKAQQDGVNIIIGPILAKTTLNVRKVINHDLPIISFSNQTDLAKDNTIIFGYNISSQIEMLENFLKSKNIKKIYALIPSNTYGVLLEKLLKENEQRMGIKIARIQNFDDSNPDNMQLAANLISESLEKEKDLKDLALFIPEGGKKINMLTQNLGIKELIGKNLTIIGSGQWDDENVIKSPELWKSFFISCDCDPEVYFREKFMKIYSYTPPRIASLAYDAVKLVYETAKPNKLINVSSVSNTGHTGINGGYNITNSGVTERKLAIWQINEKGEAEIIFR